MVRSQAAKPLTISRLAQAGGVGVETIRYYQRRGLLAVPRRGASAKGGGTRKYGEEDLRRLRFIRSAQMAGFTLEQIGELLTLDATQDRARARLLAQAQLGALNQRIAELTTARDALQKLARACGSGSTGACPILEAFEP